MCNNDSGQFLYLSIRLLVLYDIVSVCIMPIFLFNSFCLYIFYKNNIFATRSFVKPAKSS